MRGKSNIKCSSEEYTNEGSSSRRHHGQRRLGSFELLPNLRTTCVERTSVPLNNCRHGFAVLGDKINSEVIGDITALISIILITVESPSEPKH